MRKIENNTCAHRLTRAQIKRLQYSNIRAGPKATETATPNKKRRKVG